MDAYLINAERMKEISDNHESGPSAQDMINNLDHISEKYFERVIEIIREYAETGDYEADIDVEFLTDDIVEVLEKMDYHVGSKIRYGGGCKCFSEPDTRRVCWGSFEESSSDSY